MENKSFLATLKKNAMLVVMVLVYLFFLILTKGGIFAPSSFTELINQNAYVYILGTGMLMCMLTGGNIDLSCGAFPVNVGDRRDIRYFSGIPDRLCPHSALDCNTVRIPGIPRSGYIDPVKEFQNRFSGTFSRKLPEFVLRQNFPDRKGYSQYTVLCLRPAGCCCRSAGYLPDQKEQTGKGI